MKNSSEIDYIVVGSGLSGLVFAALAANAGARVVVLEAHEHPGGYGHTFQMGKSAKFNAQLHYVWNCGENETVNLVLKQLGLEKQITFEQLDPNGFDHMFVPGHSIKIPGDPDELIARLTDICPDAGTSIARFIKRVHTVARGLDLIASKKTLPRLLSDGYAAITAGRYLSSSLQNVFEDFSLPKPVQALLASQWPDFLLPPEKLSFFAWVMLFTGYQRGAYYPTQHFEHVINSLVDLIEARGSRVALNQEVLGFIRDADKVIGVTVQDRCTGKKYDLSGGTVISNMDPKRTAQMIGVNEFDAKIQDKLNYEYSPSNLMIYCTVEGIDLTKHGFGKWNTFHSGDLDINASFARMYEQHDYTNPSFAITTPGLMTSDKSDRPSEQQIMEFLTVADYAYFDELKSTNRREYLKKKREIVDHIFDVVEKKYIPNFRQHVKFKIAGTPTTNENFCWSPEGNSYGSNMTPNNIGLRRLSHDSSIAGLYFCNASAGFPGFSGAFWNGRSLFSKIMF